MSADKQTSKRPGFIRKKAENQTCSQKIIGLKSRPQWCDWSAHYIIDTFWSISNLRCLNPESDEDTIRSFRPDMTKRIRISSQRWKLLSVLLRLPSEDHLTFFISQVWTRRSPVIQVSAAATWSLIAPSDKQSFPLLCFAVRPCPWFSLQLCSLSAFIVHKLIKVSGFLLSDGAIRGGREDLLWVLHLIDAAAGDVSLTLTLRLCLFLRCRSVREEERPEGLRRLHLSIRRRLQRRRRSAQMCLPVPGTKHQELSFFSRFNSAVIYTFLSSQTSSF